MIPIRIRLDNDTGEDDFRRSRFDDDDFDDDENEDSEDDINQSRYTGDFNESNGFYSDDSEGIEYLKQSSQKNRQEIEKLKEDLRKKEEDCKRITSSFGLDFDDPDKSFGLPIKGKTSDIQENPQPYDKKPSDSDKVRQLQSKLTAAQKEIELKDKIIADLKKTIEMQKTGTNASKRGTPTRTCSKCSVLLKNLEAAKNQLYDSQDIVMKQKNELEECHEEIEKLRQQLAKSNSDNEIYQNQLSEAAAKLNSLQMHPNDLEVDLQVIRGLSFDKALEKEIIEIMQHEHLMQTSKVQVIFSRIAKYVEEDHVKLENKIKEMQNENENMKYSFNNFLAAISLIVDDQPLSLDTLNTSHADVIIESLKALKTQNANLVAEVAKYVPVMDILVLMGYDESISPQKYASNLQQSIEKLCDTVKRLKKKLLNKTNVVSFLANEIQNIEKEKDTQLEKSRLQIVDHKHQLESVLNELGQSRKELTEMSLEMQKSQIELEDTKKSLIEEQEKRSREERISRIEEYHTQRTYEQPPPTPSTFIDPSIYDSLAKAQIELEKVKQENIYLNKTVSDYENVKQQLQQKTDELQKLKEEFSSYKISTEAQQKLAKQNICAAYDKAMGELMRNLESYRNDVVKLSAAESQSRMELEEMMYENDQLMERAEKAEAEVESTRIELNQMKKMMQTIEKTNNARERIIREKAIDDIKQKDNNDIIVLCAYIMQYFPSFTDPLLPHDVNFAKSAISRAAGELQKLRDTNRAVRRILHAKEGQTTEDAAAQLTMRM